MSNITTYILIFVGGAFFMGVIILFIYFFILKKYCKKFTYFKIWYDHVKKDKLSTMASYKELDEILEKWYKEKNKVLEENEVKK